ncbi:hypothetical protein BU17DRAFT_63993 [Hysterangium stoloniferum]|nr:hypothetical protein BU17DRAFT_63993 [Hysterangium stoloniferum]
MTTFNPSFDWDSNISPSIPSLDENDFMLLLQTQFPSISGTPIPSSAATKKPAVETANPQSLDKYQIPSSISPLSTDSSPSPPSAHEDNNSPNGSNNHKRSVSTEEEPHKRKASTDDFDDEIGQPSAKNQHTDGSRKNSLTRRKSSGGEKGPDETRLLKRKEQNRAAQRAFRERKEKHVKDLEDKVAQLEAKTETQAAENDNLRDMLSRLQNENTLLKQIKQSSFTFSMPSSSSAGPSDLTRPTRSSSGSINMFNSSGADAGRSHLPSTSSGLPTSPSNNDSSPTLFDQFDSFSTLNASTPTSSVTTPGGSVNVNSTLSPADLDTMALFGSTGFTTISSNPMYTSYRDPIQSMNAFASFGGWDGDIAMDGALNGTAATTADSSSMDGLFGDPFSGLTPLPQDFLTDETTASPSATSSGIGVTSHKIHGDCPKTKADVERMIAQGPKGTFGALPITHSDAGSSGGSAPSVGLGVNEYDTAFQEALGNVPTKPVCTESYNIDDLCIEMQRKAKCTMQQHC